ncbi:MAG TPA: ABC transporter permease [Candidatus Dormibacteraeota bacterium]|nr:ABC transporter permease [Candidatus Dormibacteraeota bacterium]
MRFLGRRLVHGLFLLVGSSVLSFLLLELAPGDFFEEMRLNPQISPLTVAALRHQYGMDRSLPVRYLLWVRSVMKGELGFSFSYNLPVSGLLLVRARNTLLLTATSALLAWILALALGIWGAVQPGGWGGRMCGGVTSSLLAIPELLMGLALLSLAVRTGWFPSGGLESLGAQELSLWGRLKDVAWHMALPTAALTLAAMPVITRHVRSAMAEALEAPFLRALRGHGIRRSRLILTHALRAASNPLISLLGLSIAGLLSGSLLIEVLLSWPGLGPLLLEAILSRDIYVVIGTVLCSTVFLLAGNFLADLLLYASDPRMRVS